MATHDDNEETTEAIYVLVTKEKSLPSLDVYMSNLTSLGIQLENIPGQTVDVIFIKVSISSDSLGHFSELYEIGNYHASESYRPSNSDPIFFSTPFTTPVSVIEPTKEGEFTNAESIMIVHKLLESTKFGHNDNDYGLAKLKKRGFLLDSYPLHQGPAVENGENDRSLLLRFWSNVALLHKEQPLDLVQRYFGHEVAFYFAWLEYFNMSLYIPSLIGGIVFIIGLVRVTFFELKEVRDICHDMTMYLCPVCEHGGKTCKFVPIATTCTISQWDYVFDNYFTVAFAVYMSFVATLFTTLWQRKEYMLKLRWNADFEIDHSQNSIRAAYRERVKRRRRNKLTGELEPQTPEIVAIFRYTISIMVCVIMVLIMLGFLCLNIVTTIEFRHIADEYGSKYLKRNKIIYSIFIGAFIQLFYIKFMAQFFGPLTMKLTNFENPRTQEEFDNSLLYKRFILAFINNLMPLFYIAFLKGNLYTVPHENTFYMKQDVCQPQSCIVPLCIQLTFLLTLRSLAGNLGNFLFPHIKSLYKKIFRIKDKEATVLPPWEEEYFLEPCGKYFLSSEYAEMMVKYAMVTFFVGAFPLAPACALINNLIELRTDAYKLVRAHRRPVPVRSTSIGVWNQILVIMSYMSTATNAFVIAFTSDFVVAQMYNVAEKSKKGFYHFILSKYDPKSYEPYQQLENSVDICYYRGQYHPPGHPDAYKHNTYYWMTVTARFCAIFIFEHIVLLCNAALSYLIPPIPYSVLQKEYLEQKQEIKKKVMQEADTNIAERLLKVDTNYIS